MIAAAPSAPGQAAPKGAAFVRVLTPTWPPRAAGARQRPALRLMNCARADRCRAMPAGSNKGVGHRCDVARQPGTREWQADAWERLATCIAVCRYPICVWRVSQGAPRQWHNMPLLRERAPLQRRAWTARRPTGGCAGSQRHHAAARLAAAALPPVPLLPPPPARAPGAACPSSQTGAAWRRCRCPAWRPAPTTSTAPTASRPSRACSSWACHTSAPAAARRRCKQAGPPSLATSLLSTCSLRPCRARRHPPLAGSCACPVRGASSSSGSS